MEKDKTIKIFLASSEELKEDRVWFGDFVQGIDKIYQERGKRVDLCKWEFFDAANNDRRKQDEYNESNLVKFESKSVEESAEGEGKNA